MDRKQDEAVVARNSVYARLSGANQLLERICGKADDTVNGFVKIIQQ